MLVLVLGGKFRRNQSPAHVGYICNANCAYDVRLVSILLVRFQFSKQQTTLLPLQHDTYFFHQTQVRSLLFNRITKNIRRAGSLEVINPEVAVELHISMVLSDTSSTKGSSSHCSGKDSTCCKTLVSRWRKKRPCCFEPKILLPPPVVPWCPVEE